MNITIGKAADNDFVVDDASVSRHHARLTKDSDGCLFLEDLGSTNGTFVDGCQIMKKRVVLTSEIRLGNHYVLSLSEVLKSNNDYSEEFAKLEQVYARYVQEKVKIQSSNQFKARLFQSLPFVLLALLGVGLSVWGKQGPEWKAFSLLITACASAVGIYIGAKQAAHTPKQLQALANQFKIDYVCPKCGTFLGEIPWESLRNRKHCFNQACKAKWVSDDSL